MPTRTVTHAGNTLTIRDWSQRTNLSQRTIYHRLDAGWSVEEALTTPARKRSMKPQRGAYLESEFYKLVASIDGALRVFRKRVGSYVFDELDRGVVENFSKRPSDRCSRVTQDRA